MAHSRYLVDSDLDFSEDFSNCIFLFLCGYKWKWDMVNIKCSLMEMLPLIHILFLQCFIHLCRFGLTVEWNLSFCVSLCLALSPTSCVTAMFNSHPDGNLSHTPAEEWIFQLCEASQLQSLSPLQRRNLFRFICTPSWNIELLVKSMNLLFRQDVILCLME